MNVAGSHRCVCRGRETSRCNFGLRRSLPYGAAAPSDVARSHPDERVHVVDSSVHDELAVTCGAWGL